MLAVLLWLSLALILLLATVHRCYLVSEIWDYDIHGTGPQAICASYNRFLFPELLLHTAYSVGVLACPSRSLFLFLVNLPLVVRDWRLFFLGRFYFSPHRIVRDRAHHSRVAVAHAVVFALNFPFLLWKLFAVAFLSGYVK
jgi:hypothetical protein